MKTPLKIALAIAVGLGLALLVGSLAGCGSHAPVVPPGPPVAVAYPAARNRALGELQALARSDAPLPDDLSEADRVTVAQMRQARGRR